MIRRIILQNFRNYSFFEIDFEKNVNFIAGKNGTGKTNLLEAISLLSFPSGFRGSDSNSLNRNFSLSFSICMETNIGEIGIKNSKTGKKITRNSENIPFSELLESFKIFSLLPENESTFNDPPAQRREFFDKMCAKLYPLHELTLKNLKSLSISRIKILEEEGQNTKWLEVLEKQISEFYIILATNRVLFCEEISKITKALPATDLSCILNVTGSLEEKIKSGHFKALEEENNLQKKLKDTRKVDKITHKTLTGFEKANFEAFLNNKTSACHTSSGEQKKILFSCILAAAKKLISRKNHVILLIDEVISKLDSQGQESVINELSRLEAQSFLTSTSIPSISTSFNIISL